MSPNTAQTKSHAAHATPHDDDIALECVVNAEKLIQAIQNFGGRFLRQVMTASALALLTMFLLFQYLGRFSASTQFAMLRHRTLIVIAPRA